MNNLNFDYCKNILITGGCGFIGGNLIINLLQNTNSRIFNIDKLGYASDTNRINNFLAKNNEKKSRYQFFNLDLRENEKIDQAIQLAKPDLIFHLAAESHVDNSIKSPGIFIENNIIGTYNLIDSSFKYWDSLNSSEKSNFRFLHISTDEVFGSLGELGSFNENSPYDPRSPYSASKASSDHLANAWFHTYGFPVIITNCSNNFGPWQFPEKLIPLVTLRGLKKEFIPLYGDGKNVRDWLFVEDHINALILVASKGEIGSRYCIGGSNEKSNYEVIKNICKHLDDINPNHSPHIDLLTYVEDRPGHDRRYSINSKKIREELGWEEKNSFEKNIKKTIFWYAQNIEWCNEMLKRSF
ncbi:dTDP-glucose 4,6-dehydratase [uncultured Prochlorococcus sp.]|uniref:dTDP-glucose 4,6-dehydratase n=1 Tax=uncultured Prochlorococcus sp. TaxID=159733 RepID=UPI00258403B4|nr:dTDP-glucose 4,6-dehydratase [uncultured Prochlorococcus sp.]